MATRRRAKKTSALSVFIIGAFSLVIFAIAVFIGVTLLNSSGIVELPSSSDSSASSDRVSVINPDGEPSEEPQQPDADASRASSSSEASAPAPVSSSSSAPPESSESGPSGGSASSGTSSAAAGGSSSAGASSAIPVASSSTPATPATFDMGSSGFANIASYQQINSDVHGWLRVPGTNVDYPVLRSSSGMNPHYYLDKNLYKQTDRNAVVYAGSTVKFGTPATMSRNSVLFGHNWTNYSASPRIGNENDVMFAQLAAYHHLDFAKQHPYIWFSSSEQEMAWVVFSCFYTDISFNYIEPNPTDSVYSSIIDGAIARSRHIFDVDVDTSDKILTLSTCTRAYGQSDKQRFVIMARLMRAGEQFTGVDVKPNPSPVLPKL